MWQVLPNTLFLWTRLVSKRQIKGSFGIWFRRQNFERILDIICVGDSSRVQFYDVTILSKNNMYKESVRAADDRAEVMWKCIFDGDLRPGGTVKFREKCENMRAYIYTYFRISFFLHPKIFIRGALLIRKSSSVRTPKKKNLEARVGVRFEFALIFNPSEIVCWAFVIRSFWFGPALPEVGCFFIGFLLVATLSIFYYSSCKVLLHSEFELFFF